MGPGDTFGVLWEVLGTLWVLLGELWLFFGNTLGYFGASMGKLCKTHCFLKLLGGARGSHGGPGGRSQGGVHSGLTESDFSRLELRYGTLMFLKPLGSGRLGRVWFLASGGDLK